MSEKIKSMIKTKKAKIILSVCIIFFAFLTVSGIAVGRHFHKFHDGPGAFLIDRISEKLDLTSSQKTQVEKIKTEIKEKFESRKSDRGNMFEDFANEFRKDNLDKNALKELQSKKEQNKKEMEDFMMDKIIEFHNILTPEQRNKAMDAMKEMGNKFHRGMDKHGDKDDKDRPQQKD